MWGFGWGREAVVVSIKVAVSVIWIKLCLFEEKTKENQWKKEKKELKKIIIMKNWYYIEKEWIKNNWVFL